MISFLSTQTLPFFNHQFNIFSAFRASVNGCTWKISRAYDEIFFMRVTVYFCIVGAVFVRSSIYGIKSFSIFFVNGVLKLFIRESATNGYFFVCTFWAPVQTKRFEGVI